jgi:uncharacterized protein
MPTDPAFEVDVDEDADLGETLVVGVADIGVAGLTTVDYLTSHAETSQIGHVRTHGVPDITPFSEGVPRHPIRLYSTAETDLSVLLSEVFLPVGAADRIAEAVYEWAQSTGFEEIVLLFGAPFPHGEAEHTVFHVATEGFREHRLADTDIEGLPGGFFDGIVGELVTRGLEPETPEVGVLVTPSHPPGPDLDGALRLLEGFERVYDVDVDESELQTRAEEMKQYYQELANRMQNLQESEGSRDYPEDRMYM